MTGAAALRKLPEVREFCSFLRENGSPQGRGGRGLHEQRPFLSRPQMDRIERRGGGRETHEPMSGPDAPLPGLASALRIPHDRVCFDQPGDGAIWVRGGSYKTRSAALGDTILSGTTRWYQVQNTDPAIYECSGPGLHNLDLTNALVVDWRGEAAGVRALDRDLHAA